MNKVAPDQLSRDLQMVMTPGTCGTDTTRTDIINPTLESMGIKYYDPQTIEGGWDAAIHPPAEAKAKEFAHLWLGFLTSKARSLVATLELVAGILEGRNMILVIQDIPAGTIIEDQVVTIVEARFLNQARQFVRDLACLFDVPVYNNTNVFMDKNLISEHMARPQRKSLTQAQIRSKITSLLPDAILEDSWVATGTDVLDIRPMLYAYVLGAAQDRTIRLVVPSREQLEQLAGTVWFDGVRIEGRRAKDQLRLIDPYFADVSHAVGVEIRLGSPEGDVLKGSF